MLFWGATEEKGSEVPAITDTMLKSLEFRVMNYRDVEHELKSDRACDVDDTIAGAKEPSLESSVDKRICRQI